MLCSKAGQTLWQSTRLPRFSPVPIANGNKPHSQMDRTQRLHRLGIQPPRTIYTRITPPTHPSILSGTPPFSNSMRSTVSTHRHLRRLVVDPGRYQRSMGKHTPQRLRRALRGAQVLFNSDGRPFGHGR